MCFPLGWSWKVLGPVTHRGTHILSERKVMVGALVLCVGSSALCSETSRWSAEPILWGDSVHSMGEEAGSGYMPPAASWWWQRL